MKKLLLVGTLLVATPLLAGEKYRADDTCFFRSYIEGPRFAGITTFLKNDAFVRGLTLTLDVDKGLIRENVRFKVEGACPEVERFAKDLQDSIDEYNGVRHQK